MKGKRRHIVKQCVICRKNFNPWTTKTKCCSLACASRMRGLNLRKPESWYFNKVTGYMHGRAYFPDGTRFDGNQHRWIMMQALGRRLAANEHVHHINGIKTDNRLENLQVLTNSEHHRITIKSIGSPRGRRLNLSSEQRAARAELAKRIGLQKIGHKAKVEKGLERAK
jgi:hypothetical protein